MTDVAGWPGDPLRYEVLDLVRTPFPEPWPDAHARHSVAGFRKDRGHGTKTPRQIQGGAVISGATASMTSALPGVRQEISWCPRTAAFATLAPWCRSPDTSGPSTGTDTILTALTRPPDERVTGYTACQVSKRMPGRRSLFLAVDRRGQGPRWSAPWNRGPCEYVRLAHCHAYGPPPVTGAGM